LPRNINITGFHGTRTYRDKRVVYNGIVNEDDIVFSETLAGINRDATEVHELIKGLFKARPFLIHASPQQVAIELTVQRCGLKHLATVGGTTITGARAMLAVIVEHLDLYGISNALSRMKQHDRDLAEDPDTEKEIKEWRRDNPPKGDPNARTKTLIQSLWVNKANNALSQIDQANALKSKHPSLLRTAPRLKLCEEKKNDKCKEVDRAMISALFPDVK